VERVTDGELMQAVQAGDGQAFSTLVHRYHAPLRGYVLRLTQDPHVTDDLVQETFLRVYTRANTFGSGRSFRPWVYRIATNLFFDWQRRRRDTPVGLASDGTAAGLATGTDPTGDGLTSVVRSEEQQQVRTALARLGADHRAILLLRFDRELSLGEIAEALDIPVGTVKSRLFRALRQFRSQLDDGGEGDADDGGKRGADDGAPHLQPTRRSRWAGRQEGGEASAAAITAAARR
jgi:RNA polymerase sigma-70 factor (ECF subfamily)